MGRRMFVTHPVMFPKIVWHTAVGSQGSESLRIVLYFKSWIVMDSKNGPKKNIRSGQSQGRNSNVLLLHNLIAFLRDHMET